MKINEGDKVKSIRASNMKKIKLQQGIQAKHGNARFRYPIVPKVDAENESVGKYQHSEGEGRILFAV
jgi:hypothetical protein